MVCVRGAAILVMASAVSCAWAAAAEAGTLTIPLHFAAPELTRVDGGATTVHVEGLMNTVDAGLPSVPVKTLVLALPPGATLAGIDFKPDEAAASLDAVTLAKAPALMPLSWHGKVPASFKRQAEAAPAFAGDRYPPADAAASQQKLHGVALAVVNVFPVRVGKGEGSVRFVQGGVLTVRYAEPSASLAPPELLPSQREDLNRIVDNARQLDAYPDRASISDGYDYLIVTSDTFANYTGQWGLKDLVDGLATRGLKAKVVTVSSITGSTAGNDTADKIRNYVRAEYQAAGIQYLLLAGDGDKSGSGNVIPARRMWSRIRSYDGQWTTIEEQIPADLYYACLDGTFNANGNTKWGEPGDGENGGDVDFLCELTVGRMPMKTTAELQNFVRKTLWVYSNQMPKKGLLMGEELFPELDLYGDDYMDQLVGQCTDHAYTTNGYGTDWALDRMYDRRSTWSGNQALSKIGSGGYTMVNHLGHSNTDYNMRLSSGFSFPNFQNATPFFYYTQGCFPGDFTANDSFIEKLVRNTHGAVAAIANTNYGLAPEDPQPDTTKTPGGSQMLHRRFIDAVFSGGLVNLGKAHMQSKAAFVGLTSAQEIRWVNWDANYFGDPSLELRY